MTRKENAFRNRDSLIPSLRQKPQGEKLDFQRKVHPFNGLKITKSVGTGIAIGTGIFGNNSESKREIECISQERTSNNMKTKP